MPHQLITNVPDYITDCKTPTELTMNLIEKMTPDTFKYSENLEDKMWSCIVSRILNDKPEDIIKKEIRKLVKRNIGRFFLELIFNRIYNRIRKSIGTKFD